MIQKILNKTVSKNKFMYITPDITDCDYTIMVYLRGKHSAKFKNIPRVFIKTDHGLIPVLILSNKVICMSTKYRKERNYIKTCIRLFKKSWNDVKDYGTKLPEILANEPNLMMIYDKKINFIRPVKYNLEPISFKFLEEYYSNH